MQQRHVKSCGSYVKFISSFSFFSFTSLLNRHRSPPNPPSVPHRVALAPAPFKVLPPESIISVAVIPPKPLCLAKRKTPACLRAHIGFCKCVTSFETAEQLIVGRLIESKQQNDAGEW